MIRLGRGMWKGHILRPTRLPSRPTSSLVRGAFLDIVGFHRLEEAAVWDLCAGSGAVGLEALSAGALSCLFVDRDPGATALIRSFLREHGATDRCQVITGDVRKVVDGISGEPDIVFIDPPYGSVHLFQWIDSLDWEALLLPGGMVFAESGDPGSLVNGWTRRKYGDSYLNWKERE